MEVKTRYLLYVSNAIMSLAFGAANPIIAVYFYSILSPDIVALSTTLATGIGLLSQSVFAFTSAVITKIKRWYAPLLFLDCAVYFALNYFATDYPAVRFIGVSIEGALLVCLIDGIMQDCINTALDNKDDKALTIFNARRRTVGQSAMFVGGVIATGVLQYIVPDIDAVLILMTIACIITAMCDYTAFKQLRASEKGGFLL